MKRVAAVALIMGAIVSACAGDQPERGLVGSPPSRWQTPGAAIDWAPCADQPGFECATLEVPLDHSKPGEDTIDLALILRPADDRDDRLGTIVWNPGGPGGEAVANTPQFGDFFGLGKQFDIIGMDPRGVGRSTPVVCDTNLDPMFDADPFPSTQQGREESARWHAAFAQSCRAGSGSLLEHVGTTDVVEDLELLRRSLGEKQLNFLGLSYGTYLGGAYADRYPERVRAFFLDGALVPTIGGAEAVVGQARALGQAIETFLADCDTNGGCGFAQPGQARTVFEALIAGSRADPLTVGERTLGPGWLLAAVGPSAIAGAATWPSLDAALSAAVNGDPSPLFALADRNAGRRADGTYAPTIGSEAAVACLDPIFPTSQAELDAVEAAVADESPLALGPIEFGWRACADWPVPPRERPEPFVAEGSSPILVVGTTGDPSTPYAWAEEMAKTFQNASLLTLQAEGHTALPRSSCIQSYALAYFTDLALPPAGARC